MIRIMPKWYSKAEDDLKREIIRIAIENKINFRLVLDSKSIEDCKGGILNSLVMISEEGREEEMIYGIEKQNKKKKSKGETKKTNKKKVPKKNNN